MSIEQVLARHPGPSRDHLIPLLQELQEELGFLSRPAIRQVAEHLGLPASKVWGVATFYNQFRFQPRGRFPIAVCRGTACHVKGSAAVLAALQRELKIEPGATTRDGLFSLEVVACIGACGLAPVIAVGDDYHAGVTPQQVGRILADCRRRAAEDAPAEAVVEEAVA
ncbi:MAG: NADH-quinone oxidoreductase subunit NuoE [Candidatus Delongbacteria bacterium]